MEINPRITIQNTDKPHWIVRMEHEAEESRFDITCPVPRTVTSVHAIQSKLMRRAADQLLRMADRIDDALALGQSPSAS